MGEEVGLFFEIAVFMAIMFLAGLLPGLILSLLLRGWLQGLLVAGLGVWFADGYLQYAGRYYSSRPVGPDVKDAYYVFLFYYYVVPPFLLGLASPILRALWRGERGRRG